MRPIEVQKETIVQAGQALQAEGKAVTGFALRQRIGAGSPPRLRQVWAEHLGASAGAAEALAEVLPLEMEEPFAALSAQLLAQLKTFSLTLHQQVTKSAERRAAAAVQAVEERHAASTRELLDAAQVVEELERRLAQAQADQQDLQQRLAAAETQSHQKDVTMAQLSTQLAASEAQVTELQARNQEEARAAQAARLAQAQLEGQVTLLEKMLKKNAP